MRHKKPPQGLAQHPVDVELVYGIVSYILVDYISIYLVKLEEGCMLVEEILYGLPKRELAPEKAVARR